MEYLVTFYEVNSSKPRIKEKQFMSERDIMIMYEQMLHIARDQATTMNYPSPLFEVYKVELITDNS